MTFRFNPSQSLIIVEAEITGPTTDVSVRLALDTGATDSFLDESWLAIAGYTQADATNKFDVLTASGQITVFEVPLRSLTALGQTRTNFPIQAHSFPPGTGHDGVLGLDFFRRHIMTLDFVNGEITLAPGPAAGPTP